MGDNIKYRLFYLSLSGVLSYYLKAPCPSSPPRQMPLLLTSQKFEAIRYEIFHCNKPGVLWGNSCKDRASFPPSGGKERKWIMPCGGDWSWSGREGCVGSFSKLRRDSSPLCLGPGPTLTLTRTGYVWACWKELWNGHKADPLDNQACVSDGGHPLRAAGSMTRADQLMPLKGELCPEQAPHTRTKRGESAPGRPLAPKRVLCASGPWSL